MGVRQRRLEARPAPGEAHERPVQHGGAAPSGAGLETRGARTGRPRRNATLYFHDGDRVTIIASKRGEPKNPAWYHNLRRHPDVIYGGLPFRAEIVEDEAERRRLWELADLVFPEFAGYRVRAAKAGRVVPSFSWYPASSPRARSAAASARPTILQPRACTTGQHRTGRVPAASTGTTRDRSELDSTASSTSN